MRGDPPSEQAVVIPDKLYFKIGEVCRLTGIKQHVLRYWEAEFPILRPQRASSRQRLYRRVDVENILTIRRLLQIEGYTIAGARKYFAARGREAEPAAAPPAREEANRRLFRQIKDELCRLRSFLERG